MFDLIAGVALIGLAGWIGYQFGRQAGYEEATARRKIRQNGR
jgi:hypothetical protein